MEDTSAKQTKEHPSHETQEKKEEYKNTEPQAKEISDEELITLFNLKQEPNQWLYYPDHELRWPGTTSSKGFALLIDLLRKAYQTMSHAEQLMKTNKMDVEKVKKGRTCMLFF